MYYLPVFINIWSLSLACLVGANIAWAAEDKVTTESAPLDKPTPFPALLIDPMTYDEPYDAGWQLYFDNDLFTASDRDRDYTGGIGFAFSGRRAREWRFSMDEWLDNIDDFIGVQELQYSHDGFLRHTMEFGLVLLTPDNIALSEPQVNDHPFANFLFMANSQQVIFTEKRWILFSALTLGLLGTDAGPKVQSLIHSVSESEQPRGWDNQISNGGELTGKYSLMAQKNILQRYNRFSYEVSATVDGNIGFNTDISVGISTRFGSLNSPWWSFAPHQSDYINLGQSITSRIDERLMPAELFGWAGVKAKYSVYNGFLQGQFRDSKVKFDSDELEHSILEGSLGITKTWSSGFGLSYFIRARTGEIKGAEKRNPVWSGLIISFTS